MHHYIIVLEYGVKRLKTLPLSLRLTRELHERLMKGVRGGRATPGEFRPSQNWIGHPGCRNQVCLAEEIVKMKRHAH